MSVLMWINLIAGLGFSTAALVTDRGSDAAVGAINLAAFVLAVST